MAAIPIMTRVTRAAAANTSICYGATINSMCGWCVSRKAVSAQLSRTQRTAGVAQTTWKSTEPASGKAARRAMDSATAAIMKAAQSALKATSAANMETTATSAVEPGAPSVACDRRDRCAERCQRCARCQNS